MQLVPGPLRSGSSRERRGSASLARYGLAAGLTLVAVVNFLYIWPNHAPSSKLVSPAVTTSGPKADTAAPLQLARKLNKGQHLSKNTQPDLRIHLHCADVAPDCEKQRHAGNCSTHLLHDFHGCMSTCRVCPALAGAVRSSLGLAPGQLVVVASGAPPCADERADCEQLAPELCATGEEKLVSGCKATCGACLPAPSGTVLSPSDCYDAVDMCGWWAAGERRLCERAAEDMQHYWWVAAACRRSCGLCSPGPEQQLREEVNRGAAGKEQDGGTPSYRPNNTTLFALASVLRHGVQVGEAADGSPAVAVFEPLPLPQGGDAPACRDKQVQCPMWKAAGECTKNPGFMSDKCPVSCGTCPVLLNLPNPLARVRLNNGLLMPTVGYGCAGLGDAASQTVRWALEAGYRHLDSAQAREWYREDLVGAALGQHLAEQGQQGQGQQPGGGLGLRGGGTGRKGPGGGVGGAWVRGGPARRREDVFVTSKLHPRHLGFDVTLRQFNQTLKDLNTSYVDLFLLHYPDCWGDLCGGDKPKGTFLDSWRALEQLYDKGLARAIGVSNFMAHQLQQLLAAARVRPAVLQVHVDPLDHAQALQDMCREQGLVLTAYSTLGTQWGGGKNPVLASPELQRIGRQAGGRSAAQVALRWALQQGLVVLPRSSNRERIAQNLALYDWRLSPEQMLEVAALRPSDGD